MNSSHAANEPKVPGALGARPEPKPSETKCAGCDTSSLKEGDDISESFGRKGSAMRIPPTFATAQRQLTHKAKGRVAKPTPKALSSGRAAHIELACLS